MKKFLVLLLVVALSVCVFAACSNEPAGEEAASEDSLLIGYIMAGPDVYYSAEVDGAEYQTELNGCKFVVLNSEYDQEKELANADDLISQGADAIILMTTNADVAQKVAQKCNAADVPLFLSAWEMSEGEGKSTGQVWLDMFQSGELIGEYVAEHHAGGRGYVIAGVAGQGTDDKYTEGFKKGLGDASEIVDLQYGNWDRSTAIQLTQDMLAADPNVDWMFVENEDMAKGTFTVLAELGLDKDIAVYSMNGSPTGEEMLAAGELTCTTNQAPTYYGMLLSQMAIDYCKGLNPVTEVTAPLSLVTPDNMDEIMSWDLETLLANLDENAINDVLYP